LAKRGADISTPAQNQGKVLRPSRGEGRCNVAGDMPMRWARSATLISALLLLGDFPAAFDLSLSAG
jgi:hypothetical protein